jgi:hypothetical protein
MQSFPSQDKQQLPRQGGCRGLSIALTNRPISSKNLLRDSGFGSQANKLPVEADFGARLDGVKIRQENSPEGAKNMNPSISVQGR